MARRFMLGVLAMVVGIQATFAQESAEFPGNVSEVRLNTFNAYGSTSTNKIPRFTNTALHAGDDITYTDSATDGGSFTINEGGIFAIDLSWNLPVGGDQWIGVTLNDSSSDLLADVSSITGANRLCLAGKSVIASQSPQANCFWVGRLKKNDVIRAHSSSTSSPNATSSCNFHITKIGD